MTRCGTETYNEYCLILEELYNFFYPTLGSYLFSFNNYTYFYKIDNILFISLR